MIGEVIFTVTAGVPCGVPRDVIDSVTGAVTAVTADVIDGVIGLVRLRECVRRCGFGSEIRRIADLRRIRVQLGHLPILPGVCLARDCEMSARVRRVMGHAHV